MLVASTCPLTSLPCNALTLSASSCHGVNSCSFDASHVLVPSRTWRHDEHHQQDVRGLWTAVRCDR